MEKLKKVKEKELEQRMEKAALNKKQRLLEIQKEKQEEISKKREILDAK